MTKQVKTTLIPLVALFIMALTITPIVTIANKGKEKSASTPQNKKSDNGKSTQSSTNKGQQKKMVVTPAGWVAPVDSKDKNYPRYVISVTQGGTKLGDIIIELFNDVAPKHAANFEELANSEFYNGTAFHRVIPNFMIQGGDPNSRKGDPNTWGMGDPSQKRVQAEFNKIDHKRGIISAARSNDPNSASSQFFICVADSPWLNGQYTVYGQVLSGMDIADKIVSSKRNSGDRPDVKIEMTVSKF